ncbi:glycosyl hydrolase family 18 protein [Nocardioides sp.]|uniref:glycosyl hydrolase family 18 protein n=1 Tax=Nocardioides sp. TaxID=35761 RepID=UPI003784A109
MRLAALALAAVLAVPVPAAARAVDRAPQRVPDGLEVTGWVLESSPPAVVDRNAAGLTTVSVAGVTLRRDGGSVSTPGAGARRLLATAHRDGLRAELLVSNYSDALGDFDPARNHALLSSPQRIARVAARLASSVRTEGWDGVNIDLERVRAADGPGLVDLAAALQERMPAARTVSVDVSAATSLRGYRQGGYRLGALADAVDVVDLMTYDQHGPGWSGPGPIGALGWQRDALAALLSVVPADQVQLGVAGYGYSWPRHGTGRDLTVRQARALVQRDGAIARWRPGVGEWTARLSDGTVLWWSDRRSYDLRVTLARRAGVAGLAVWRLGSADPLR